MADTSFTAKVTTIVAAWLNIINNWGYYGRRPNYATTTGSANAQILTLETGSLYIAGSEADGDSFVFTAGFTNNAALTLQVKPSGGSNTARAVQLGGVALTGGEVIAARTYQVTRLGATWQLTSLAGSAFSLAALQLQTAAAWRTALGTITSPLTTKGDLWGYDTADNRFAVGSNGTSPVADSNQTLGLRYGYPAIRSYLAGYGMSTAGSSGTMSIAAGSATDSTNVDMMVLAAIAKTTSAWVVGTGNGGLDTGAIATGTWYHFWAIKRVDTGVVDVLFSLSATAPTMPANYTLKRRIGSGKTDGSSQWILFIQDGDLFQWSVVVNDINAANPGTSAVTATLASVPTGVNVIANFNSNVADSTPGNVGIYWSDLAVSDMAPQTAPTAPSQSQGSVSQASFGAQTRSVRTNTSAQIRYRVTASNGNTIVWVNTLSWIDRRGRDA